jgi:hypothetical protein
MIKYFLISQQELTDLLLEKDLAKRTALLVTVMSRQYTEKTSMQVITQGIGKGIASGLDALDKWTEPEPQKKGLKKS